MGKQPESFEDFVGNTGAVEKLKLLISDAKGDNVKRIPDIAFFGPSGYGKNTLARITANYLGRKIIEVNSTVIKDPLHFRGIITSGDFNATGVIIHVDECHQLPKKIQDNLLSVTEMPRELHTSYKDQVFIDRLQENISFIFSTTHAGNLRKALLTRLEAVEIMEYTPAEQLKLALNYLLTGHNLPKESIDADAVVDIAHRSRNPRQVKKFCDNVIRYMKQNNEARLTKDISTKCFDILGIDANGLTRNDRKILKYLANTNAFVGLDTLEALMNMSKNEIKENVEPYLLRKGFMVRHSAGRLITQKGQKLIQMAKEEVKNA